MADKADSVKSRPDEVSNYIVTYSQTIIFIAVYSLHAVLGYISAYVANDH